MSSSCNKSPLAVENGPQSTPICILVLGMAGSGKTTFVQKLTQISFEKYKPYVINLDLACRETPYNCNIDVRYTVNYKEVMKQYKLGPNGGIVTSLTLFATKFEKVVGLIIRAVASVSFISSISKRPLQCCCNSSLTILVIMLAIEVAIQR